MTLEQYLEDYFNKKRNQISQGNQTVLNRNMVQTFDLTTAPGVPQPINIPFTGVVSHKTFITATGVATTGAVKILFDQDNTANIANGLIVQNDDAFDLNGECSKGYITWDAQPGISMTVSFMNDISFRRVVKPTSITASVSNTCDNPVPVAFCDPPHVIVDSAPVTHVIIDSPVPLPVSGTVAVSGVAGTVSVTPAVNFPVIPAALFPIEGGNPTDVNVNIRSTSIVQPVLITGVGVGAGQYFPIDGGNPNSVKVKPGNPANTLALQQLAAGTSTYPCPGGTMACVRLSIMTTGIATAWVDFAGITILGTPVVLGIGVSESQTIMLKAGDVINLNVVGAGPAAACAFIEEYPV